MKFGVVILLVLTLTSCFESATFVPDEPKNFLSSEEMVPILTDVMIAEGMYQTKYVQVSRYSTLLLTKCDSIFTSHGINREIFDENMRYYSVNQEQLKEIYQKVKENVQKKLELYPFRVDETIETSSAIANDGKSSQTSAGFQVVVEE